MLEDIKNQIRRYNSTGCGGIRVVQSKRYLNADALSVDGKWYPVITSPCAELTISVTYEQKCFDVPWLDENGRAISEVSYGA